MINLKDERRISVGDYSIHPTPTERSSFVTVHPLVQTTNPFIPCPIDHTINASIGSSTSRYTSSQWWVDCVLRQSFSLSLMNGLRYSRTQFIFNEDVLKARKIGEQDVTAHIYEYTTVQISVTLSLKNRGGSSHPHIRLFRRWCSWCSRSRAYGVPKSMETLLYIGQMVLRVAVDSRNSFFFSRSRHNTRTLVLYGLTAKFLTKF